MSKELSKSQIDKLGDRLKRGNITEADLRLLDQYRRSFTEAYETVVHAIRDDLHLEPTGRPAKSTTSISDKLRRESIRLSQIQDIAGCRLVVENINEQNKVVESLSKLFERVNIIDRRERPSHGYRAVHIVVTHGSKAIEIQVRTVLQHAWAELSEKLSDRIDPAVKYGGGGELVQEALAELSLSQADIEDVELRLAALGIPSANSAGDLSDLLADLSANLLRAKQRLMVAADLFASLERENDDISD